MENDGQDEGQLVCNMEKDGEATSGEDELTPLTPYERIQQKMPVEKTLKDKTMGEKISKAKLKANRELGDLEQNQILNSRLRSSSSKVYSASLTVDASENHCQKSKLTTVNEVEQPNSEMCLKDDCCKNTSTLITMINKLQESVDGVMNKLSDQETATSDTNQSILAVQEQCGRNTDSIDSLETELKETRGQLKLVQNIVIQQDQQINFLKNKIVEIQQREMGANIVISGIS